MANNFALHPFCSIFVISKQQHMARHNEMGRWGEDVAAEYLRQQGYVIRERDWKSGRRDIDIIALTPDALTVVDPVMGDHGKLYHGFTPELVQGIRELATHADVITPNLTEAALLLGEEPNTAPLSLGQARSLLARLSALGPGVVVITGAALTTGEYANLCYDRERGGYWKSVSEYLPVRYPGTGDLFAAVLTAGLMQGDSPAMAMDRATRYVEITVKTTFGYGADSREGVMLERTLGWLTQKELPRGYRTL